MIPEPKEGIPFTTVVLKSGSLDNSIGSITDDQGVFEIDNVPEGKYTVEIQFIGIQITTAQN